MKNVIIKYFFAILFVSSLNNTIPCFSQELQDGKLLSKIKGTWIYHNKSGFELIQINDLNDIVVYNYTNREIEVGESEINLKHWFYKSSGKIVNINNNIFSIQTDRFRFDYLLEDDELIELEKSVIGKKLIRMENSQQ